MPITVDRLYRFPVKGLQGEPLEAVHLAAGRGVPHDRRFALARGGRRGDGGPAAWRPKQSFETLMRNAALARLQCRVDLPAGTVELRAPDATVCVASFETAAGRAQIGAYVDEFLGEETARRTRWLEAGAASFTDVPQNCLSLINLASVRELESHVGTSLHPLRFRANVYLSGAPPWAEFEWIGQELRIGDATVRIPARIPRCAATAANPESGERDVNIVQALRQQYGHYDMGVYAEVVGDGRVARGDLVTPPGTPRARSRLGHWLRFLTFLARGAPAALRRGTTDDGS